MKCLWLCVIVWLIPVSALAQGAAPAETQGASAELSRLWIVAGAASGTLRGHCQDCGQSFPFRHGGALVADVGYRVNSRLDVGADGFFMQWRNESGRIRATAINAVAQFRPWESSGFFVKGGAGMALVRNFVRTSESNSDFQKALSVVIGGGWEFKQRGPLGLQLFAMQHVGALGDLQTVNGPISNVTANFWSLGAAIVVR